MEVGALGCIKSFGEFLGQNFAKLDGLMRFDTSAGAVRSRG
jgi:hypothetical protein